MADDDFTVSNLRFMFGEINLQDWINRQRPSSFDEFCQTLYRDLDGAIRNLSKAKNILADNKAGEDLYTVVLVSQLNILGYSATHESNSGGNVDLTIESCIGRHFWLGEAKIFNSVNDAEAGYRQLVTRYTSGYPDQNKGGLLLYDVGRPSTKNAMKLWLEHLPRIELDNVDDIECRWCSENKPFVIFSNHPHPASGVEYEVRHMAVVVKHDPQDKARTAKRRRAAEKAA